jgi:hypothetical protein
MIPPLTEDDLKKVDVWIKASHLRCANAYTGAIGGFLEYYAVPTSLGTVYGVRCLVCKKDQLDLTDYSQW